MGGFEDRRGQSELVGTVFIIGLTITVAVLVVALAGGAIQAIGEETDDSLTNDAFYQMDGQIDRLVSSQVDASTEFEFPEGASVTPMPNEGNVTVTASVADPAAHHSHTIAPTTSNSTEFTIGTIAYEDRHGQTVVYQGGGLWEFPSEDFVNLRSSPPFDYDGQRINFQFVNVSDITSVNEGQSVVINKNANQSRTISERIRKNLSAQWTIDTGSKFTVPVDVNVTIESKFARAWKLYAEERMQEPLGSNDVIFRSNDHDPTQKANITLTFEDIGGSDLPSYPGPVLYAGDAAKASNLYDPFGNSTIEGGENHVNITKKGGGPQAAQNQQLAFYNETSEEWLIHGKNAPVDDNDGWYNVSSWQTGTEVLPTAEDPLEIGHYDRHGSHTNNYTFADGYEGSQICVVSYDSEKIIQNVDGVITHLEQCAANLDVENPGEYMPTDVDVNITTNVTDPVLGESETVEVNVSNVGARDSTRHDVALYHEIGGDLILADYETSDSIGTLVPGESRTLDMSWTPKNTSTDAIHAIVGVHDADTQNVSVDGRNIDLDVDISADTSHTVPQGGRLPVNATIDNTGNVGLENTNVVLREQDGTPVDRTQITLDAGNRTNVSLDWQAPIGDFDEELEVEVLNANDTHAVSPSGSADFAVNVTSVNDPAVSGRPMNVTASVYNAGTANGTQEVILIADSERVDNLIADTAEVGPLSPGESTDVTFTWDSPVDPVGGDNEVIVRSRDDSGTREFDVGASYDVEIEDVSPDVVDEGDHERDVTVEAAVTNLGDATGSQQSVELAVPDGSELQLTSTDSELMEVDGNETEFITLEGVVDAETSLTGNLSVSSEDDVDRERVIVRRDGPNCRNRHSGGDGSESDPYQISNVDQLQCMQEDLDAHYELVDDIDAYGTRYWNGGNGFDPVGAQALNPGSGESHFEGEFDGQGYKIEGLTIDRSDESFVGLFAATHYFEWSRDYVDVGDGSTIENVRLVDIDVHGRTVVGGLAGGAGGTVERVSVSGLVKSEYQQVGGIVGIGHDADLDNELVSHATVEGGYPAGVDDEHAWQYNNLGIGGIVGATGFETEIATAYSTANVTGNSAVGGITGWTSDYDSTNEQMYWVGGHVELRGDRWLDEIGRDNLDSNPTAGAIAGRMELDNDNFEDSVYSDENYRSIGEQEADADDIPRAPSEMVGPQVLPDREADNHPGITTADTEGNMANLNWTIWEPVYDINETGAIVNQSYPVFAWQVEGGFVIDEINAPDAVTEGDTVTVEATIANTKDGTDTQDIRLFTPEGNPVDVNETTLGAGETTTVSLEWDTRVGDNTTSLSDPSITVQSDDAGNAQPLDVLAREQPEFSVSSVTAPDSANATERVNVNTTIENIGGPGTQTVFLEHESGQVLDSATFDLDEGEDITENLTWFTQIDDEGDDQTVAVKTLDDERSTTIDVGEPVLSDFRVQDVTFADFADDETPVVTAGESLTAEVTIENQGGAPSTELAWLTPAGASAILDHKETTLDPGETSTFNLTWETTNPNVDVLEVHVQGEDPISEPVVVQYSLDGVAADPIDVDLTLINSAG